MAISSINKKSKKPYIILLKNFVHSLKTFLRETGLHGLKFVGDTTITFWERLFFFCAFVAAFVTTCHLISNIYAKWVSTPVIIGISPHATSILEVPFPAITVCNMNQVLRSKVSNYTEGSAESAILKILCSSERENEIPIGDMSTSFANNNLTMAEFVENYSQPCSSLLLHCRFSSRIYNCLELFQSLMTDEGLCCVFNLLSPKYLFKNQNDYKELSIQNTTAGSEPVDWHPENGYPKTLPSEYYPRPAAGTGVAMGFTIILDAQLDEYYCSSTNGPGFKLFFHNPTETPDVREAGLITPIGFETRFRIEVVRSEAVPSLRSIRRNDRQCVFDSEESLLYYKYYSRRNCETECSAKYMYETCNCIPYNLPPIYRNATICNVKDSWCLNQASNSQDQYSNTNCHSHCLPSCFDLTYTPDAFSSRLATRNYTISHSFLNNISTDYIGKNIAVMHFYYRESVYHGDMKNVYVGTTEFLSNIGGVMGLFLGFSFISIAEMFYFLILQPIISLFQNRQTATKVATLDVTVEENGIWHINELYPKKKRSRQMLLLENKRKNIYWT